MLTGGRSARCASLVLSAQLAEFVAVPKSMIECVSLSMVPMSVSQSCAAALYILTGLTTVKLVCPAGQGMWFAASFLQLHLICWIINTLCCHAGFSLLVKAPFELYNALPIPLNMSLMTTALPNMHSSEDKTRDKGWRVTIPPLQNFPLHFVGSFEQLQTIRMEPVGFTPTHMMPVPYMGSPSRWSSRSSAAQSRHHVSMALLHLFDSMFAAGKACLVFPE